MALTLKERGAQLSDRLNQSPLIIKLRTAYESLSPRDRRLFLMLVSFFAILLIGGVTWSAKNYLHRLELDINRKQDQLARVEQVRMEHEALKGQIDKVEEDLKRDKNFNLTAYLERTSTDVGFTDPVNIQSKGETNGDGFKEVSVEVRIRKASLDKILTYLYKIETAQQHLSVKDLRIRTTFGSKADLDADLEVSVLAPLES